MNANLVGVSEPYHYTAFYSTPPGGYSVPLLSETPIPANYVKGQAPQFAYPYTINYADPNITAPYVMAINLGVQQRISRSSTLDINYVGKFGRHGMIPLDQNPAIYDCSGSFYQSNPAVYCNNATTTQTSYEQRVQYPGFNYGGQGIVDNESIGTSSYNGLQVIFSQRAKNLNIYSSYAYARSIDISSNGLTNTANVPQPHHLNLEYAASDFNAQQIFNLGWILKFPSIRSAKGFWKYVVNDWAYGGIYNARTGNPVNVTLAGDTSLTDERTQRLNLVPGVNPNLPSNRHRTSKTLEWFNIQAFVTPPTGTFGNVRRNSQVGPGFINTQMDLQKFVTLAPGKTLEFRVDAFNVFNTPNLGQPSASSEQRD